MSERKKLLAIDGNSIINRAFYGMRPLTTHDGRNTNAIYGFFNIVGKQLDALRPDAVVAAFDLREPTFRHKFYDKYKANRSGMPEELHEQLEPLKTALGLFGIHVISCPGYEADDILGTCAKNAYADGADYDCYILTGDRDSLQLIGEKSFVLLATNKETVFCDEKRIAEDYAGLSPKQLLEVKALMGDSSDNVPGVAGIGEKTALKLICDFGSLDGLYEKLDDASLSPAMKKKLTDGRDDAYMSRYLCEIFKEVPLPLTFDDLKRKEIDRASLCRFFADLELRSLITRYGLDSEDAGEIKDEKIEKTDIFTAYEENFENIGANSEKTLFVFLDEKQKRLYIPQDKVFVLPLTEENMSQIFCGKFKTAVYSAKQIYSYMLSKRLSFSDCSFDFMLAAYVLSKSGNTDAYELVSKTVYDSLSCDNEDSKNVKLAYMLPKLYEDFKSEMSQKELTFLYFDIELPLSRVLANMEDIGFKVDRNGLFDFSAKLSQKEEEKKRNIYALAGCEFNVNSTKQLADVLFGNLGLPGIKKTKSGYSTDAETLEKLRPYHPIINEILAYRAVAKLKSTYADGLLAAADPMTGRIHTSFRQALTQTGRLSSVEPNLQNIPIKQEEGRELRKFFVAEDKDCIFIDADYSQIELRILAALSGDEKMISAFENLLDIHAMTASEVFGVPLELVTPELRKKAKAVNFGIVYGISDFSLAGDIGVTKAEAGAYIERYFERYPKIKSFLDSQIEFAKQNGYVKTYFGRRRYIPELSAKNKNMQNFGKRVAMNSPIQGTAADIIKIAMINTERAFLEKNLSARLILQVHDELIVECKKSEKDEVFSILEYEMEHAANLPVTLKCETASGENWYDAH